MELPRKRQRVDTDQCPIAQPTFTELIADYYAKADLQHCIELLLYADDDGELTKQIILKAALTTPEIAATLRNHKEEYIERERHKVISFSSHADKVIYSIEDRYMDLSGSEQYDAASDVIRQIEEAFTLIVEQATQEYASLGTKINALIALRCIAVLICGGQEEIGKQIRNHFQVDDSLESSMNAVIDEMSVEECERVCALEYSGRPFLKAMEQLKELADDHCVFEGLQDVIANLTCEDETEEDGEGESEEEEEEEEA